MNKISLPYKFLKNQIPQKKQAHILKSNTPNKYIIYKFTGMRA